jgi:hypothetical protein
MFDQIAAPNPVLVAGIVDYGKALYSGNAKYVSNVIRTAKAGFTVYAIGQTMVKIIDNQKASIDDHMVAVKEIPVVGKPINYIYKVYKHTLSQSPNAEDAGGDVSATSSTGSGGGEMPLPDSRPMLN